MKHLLQPRHALKLNGEMVSLTDLWKGAKGKPMQHPKYWLRQTDAVGLVRELSKKVTQNHLLETVLGRTGGTYAIGNLPWRCGIYGGLHLGVNLG